MDKDKLYEIVTNIIFGTHSNNPDASKIIAKQKLYDLFSSQLEPLVMPDEVLAGELEDKAKTGILVLDIDPESFDEITNKYETDEGSEYVLLRDAKEIIKKLSQREA